MGEPHRNYAPDLTGQTFGKLTVIQKLPTIVENGKKAGMSLCRCSCGRIVAVRNNAIKSGLTTSCGCNRHESAVKSSKWHGATVKHRRIHNIFQKMTARCYNPHHNRYRRYGGRGIRICDEWRNNFGAFLQWALSNGYQNDLTIDRIDVNGPYSPQNCRWADRITQANNTSKNRWLILDGKQQTLTQWARELDISPVTLESRLDSGWDIRKALTTPKKLPPPPKPKQEKPQKRIFTDAELIEETSRYETRQSFKIANPPAYREAYRRGIITQHLKSKREPRPIIATTPNGEVFRFQNVHDAAKRLNICRTNIVQILHGRKNIIHGFRFNYEEQE